ncbi:membrane bound O-acyl transferase family-domain-containing protein [Pendulispora brunnea]|uniref:Membrane bound O-acyl transferase family-domain-containing protein n=1 Tax=Pendulispora brunnea TaxID=2905690 RepID=A0ABZ2JUY6_9BACT
MIAFAVIFLGTAMLAAPLCIPAEAVAARTLAGYAAAACLLRVIDLACAPETFRPVQRIAILILPIVDPRRVSRMRERGFPWGRAVAGIALGAASMALFVTAHLFFAAEPPFGSTRQFARSMMAALAVLAAGESMDRLVRVAGAAAGFEIPPLYRAPALSRTLVEFWGQRWNLPVTTWLREHIHAPLARVGLRRTGTLLAFAVSGLVHVYPTAIGAGLAPAMAMGAFFLVHGAAVALEPRLGARSWPRALGHAYVVAIFALTMPLFSEALLRSIGF